MKKKLASGIMLTLLLIGMLTLAIQLVKTEPAVPPSVRYLNIDSIEIGPLPDPDPGDPEQVAYFALVYSLFKVSNWSDRCYFKTWVIRGSEHFLLASWYIGFSVGPPPRIQAIGSDEPTDYFTMYRLYPNENPFSEEIRNHPVDGTQLYYFYKIHIYIDFPLHTGDIILCAGDYENRPVYYDGELPYYYENRPVYYDGELPYYGPFNTGDYCKIRARAIYIRADGSVAPPTANITSTDNVTYTFTGNIINYSIVIERDNIVLDGAGHTLQGTGIGTGIYLNGRSNVTIKNMQIKAFNNGIYLYSSSNSTISGNNITANNLVGITLRKSTNNSILENNITNNREGIHLRYSSNNSISGNDVIANTYWGIWLYLYSNYNSISGNKIINNDDGIVLEYSSDNTVSGNNVTNNKDGVDLFYSSKNTLSGNILSANRYNFYVQGRNLSEFMHSIDVLNLVDGKPVYYLVNQKDLVINSTTHPQVGYLAIVNSTNITVEGLNLKNNGQGLLLAYTNNSRITDNNITNNYFGVSLNSTSHNFISGNGITTNLCGISLFGARLRNGIWIYVSSYNSIFGNDITNNQYGIFMMGSSNDTFYHNNFIDNTQQVEVYLVRAITWDDGYPSGGNYWSSYTDVDGYSGPYQNETGSDGIGDKPHIVWSGRPDNQDNYPLMQPYYGPVRNLNTGQSYPTIQEGINNASEGDIILALSGTYHEHVVVNKSVSLVGENRNATVIDGNGTTSPVIDVLASYVKIHNFTILNAKKGVAFTGAGSKHNILMNCKIDCMGIRDSIGIEIRNGSAGNELANNIVERSDFGILIVPHGSNTLRGNSVINRARNPHGGGFGIRTLAGGNKISDFVQDIDASNTIDGKPIIYLVNQSDLVVSQSTFPSIGYLGLVNCRNITIRGIFLESNYQGLLFAFTHNSTIEEVKVNSTTASFRNVELLYSNYNLILNNILLGRPNTGFQYAVWGIVIARKSNQNYVVGNYISNFKFGLEFSNSDNNTAIQNTIINNKDGIYVYYHSQNNIFYHNNIINNSWSQVVHDQASPSDNVWDNGYPSGGNYWSDYNGTDLRSGPYQNETESDGLGDTAYVIDANSTDRYPLMKPFSLHDIGITNVTVSKTVVGQGCPIGISITIVNYGAYDETVYVRFYANTTMFPLGIIIDPLESRSSKTIYLILDGITGDKGIYTISANASVVEGEIDTSDNIYIDGTVLVTIPGDLNGDGHVNDRDLDMLAAHWWFPQHYDVIADIDMDGKVDGNELDVMAGNWWKHV